MTELVGTDGAVYPRHEEVANAVTHGIGALFAVLGLYVLIMRTAPTGDAWKIITCIIFGVSLIILYTSSALYHGLTGKRWKGVARIVDHVSIYLLIAGTYTPFVLIILGGTWGWSLFAIVWIFAGIGITIRLVKYKLPDFVSAIPYLVMGWVALIAIGPMMDYAAAEGWGGLLLLIAGGLFYSFGTIFYAMKNLAYNQTIWHLFVLAGSIAHYFAVLNYVVPFPIHPVL